MKARIAVLGGDGIGPEVTAEARRALEAVAARFGHDFEFKEGLLGGIAYDETGDAYPQATNDLCLSTDATLFGAVGGPKWDPLPRDDKPERGLLRLRAAMDVFANLRVVKPRPFVRDASPVKPEVLEGTDMIVLRELLGGAYFGKPSEQRGEPGSREAVDTTFYTEEQIRRIVRLAFEMARDRRKKVTSVDKQNVMSTSRLWRQIAEEVGKDFPDITLEHVLVDSMSMYLISRPSSFDIVVSENMFGDILTDEAAVLTGSLGMMPSASLGDQAVVGRRGLYEPIHGSAPDIAGKNIANPCGAVLSAALLLRYSLSLPTEADAVDAAVDKVLLEGGRTADLARSGETVLGTREMGDLIVKAIATV